MINSQGDGVQTVDTRVPVTMEPRVIQSQARASVLLAGEVPGVRRRVQDTDTGAAVPRSANAKMVKYLKFSIWPGDTKWVQIFSVSNKVVGG